VCVLRIGAQFCHKTQSCHKRGREKNDKHKMNNYIFRLILSDTEEHVIDELSHVYLKKDIKNNFFLFYNSKRLAN